MRTLLGHIRNSARSSSTLIAAGGAIIPGYTYTRTGVASYIAADGTRTFVPADTFRTQHNRLKTAFNRIRNSDMLGYAVGVIGSGGALPTNYSLTNTSGITPEVVGGGVSNDGYGYIDIRIAGTWTSSSFRMNLGNYQSTPGQNVLSMWYGVVNGVLPDGFNLGLRYFDTVAKTTTLPPISKDVQRQSVVINMLNYTPSSANGITFNGGNIGETVDFTLRIGGIQFEPGTTPTQYTPLAQNAQYGTHAYRYGTQRVLIEPARTNSIRNARMEGITLGIIGSGGVLPANMLVTTGSAALSQQVVSTGTELGLLYMDLRLFGTAAATDTLFIFHETSVNIPAVTGQMWTYTNRQRLVAGDMTGFSAPLLGMIEATAAGGLVVSGNTSAATRAYEYTADTYTRTLSGGGTVANVQPYFAMAITNGAAIDITLRIYSPQMEQGGSATTLILPTAGVPAASARGDDFSYRTLSTNFNRLTGSYALRFVPNGQLPALQGILSFDDQTFNNRLLLYIDTSSATLLCLAFSGGSNTIFSGVGSVVFGQENVLVVSYTPTGARVSLNGAAVVTLAGTVPLSTFTRRYLGSVGVGGGVIQASFTSMTYYPMTLSDATMRAASTV